MSELKFHGSGASVCFLHRLGKLRNAQIFSKLDKSSCEFKYMYLVQFLKTKNIDEQIFFTSHMFKFPDLGLFHLGSECGILSGAIST